MASRPAHDFAYDVIWLKFLEFLLRDRMSHLSHRLKNKTTTWHPSFVLVSKESPCDDFIYFTSKTKDFNFPLFNL